MRKKKLLSAALAAMLAASVPLAGAVNNAVSVTASAEETEVKTEGDWQYEKEGYGNGDTVRIIKYNGSDTEVVIPATLGGKSVTAIDLGVFYDCTTLISVTVPDSVSVCWGAFQNCSSLEKIEVDENNPVYSSKDGVLFNNENKAALCDYPGGKKDVSYMIPDGVYGIDTLGNFSSPYLKSITFSKDVVQLALRAVAGDHHAFQNNMSLEEINVVEENETYSSVDGVLFSKDKTHLVRYPSAKKETSYKIPDGVTEINTGSFINCTALTEVTIPDSVTIIGDEAGSVFRGCTSLASVTIPKNVIEITNSTFAECTSLTSVKYNGTKAEWEAIEIGGYGNECLTNAEIICTDGIIGEQEPTTSEPSTSEPTSEPATSEPTSEPATSAPAESTVTPGDTDPVSEPDSSTNEPTVVEATLKNVDSENGLSGEQLDKQLFGDSGWTWGQVEKIVFTSDKLFSVQYTAVDGSTKTLGEKSAQRAEDDGIWNTEWTLDTSLMSKDKSFVKLIAKDGTADIKATIYIKKDAAKPSTDGDQANTGIALAIAPIALAASIVIVASKKKK